VFCKKKKKLELLTGQPTDGEEKTALESLFFCRPGDKATGGMHEDYGISLNYYRFFYNQNYTI
jgi:hypothetical protein